MFRLASSFVVVRICARHLPDARHDEFRKEDGDLLVDPAADASFMLEEKSDYFDCPFASKIRRNAVMSAIS